MMYLFFREPTGKILKVANNYSVADITKFGTNVVAKGKAILSKYRGGYKATGTLLNNYSFSSKFTKNGAVISLNFGAAGLYWRFINEGVRGAGGHTGSGRLRGVGSKFSFKPNGKMPPTNAIKRWITVKGISPKTGQTIDSMAYGMATEIKRRGLYRTQFVDKPIKSEYKKIPDTLVEAMAIDIDTLLEKLPDPIMRVDLERTNFTTG